MQQVRRSGNIAARARTTAGGGQAARRLAREPHRTLIGKADLDPLAICLLEVVADELLDLPDALARLVLEKARESLV